MTEEGSGLIDTEKSASPSSSSYANSRGKYDVFLSFRGADTRHGFTDYLYTDLVETGIYTFRDSEKLRIGEEISPDLLKAIEDSKVWILIFSKNYAESKWCLIELAHIVKCQVSNKGRKIYPIFYDVDVYDIKNLKGSYEKAFREHEMNFSESIVEEWREALKTVGKLKGYELKTESNMHEGRFVKKIVRDVLLELKKNYEDVSDELVGMDHHIHRLRTLLEIGIDGVRIVGVHGMGGIGKTTIAKVMYNQLCDSFDGCCFLEDVREKATQHPSGLVDLQKQLLFRILRKSFADVANANEGMEKIKDLIHKKKVLIVLDDLDEKSQFDKLVGDCNWVNKSSRIIVTTRKKEVLNALNATICSKGLSEAYKSYDPKLMTAGNSLQLFSKYAFMTVCPPVDYLSLSLKVTSIAAGLPLVLVTLGSLFLGITEKKLWIAKLKKLEKLPNKDVMGKLKISFDSLDDIDKKIFLDIACLFIGKDIMNPYYMWEDCGFVPEDGINTLVLRSLVKIGNDNKLEMHYQLRDLGRQIVREEGMYKHSRVWNSQEALDMVEGGLRLETIEALNLDLRDFRLYEDEKPMDVEHKYLEIMSSGPFGWKRYYVRHFTGQSLSPLQNLRFIRLHDVILDTFAKLIWLEWKCIGESNPTNLNMKNLVILDISNSHITDDWEAWNQFEMAKKMRSLNMSGCSGLVGGLNLSTFINLEILNMKNCISMIRLPDTSNLKKLNTLLLGGWEKLHYAEGLGDLVSLEYLDMSGCNSIKRLHKLSNLRMLRKLHLQDCNALYDIEGLGGLVSLEQLVMNGCNSIERLSGLSNLRILKQLLLNSCFDLRDVEGLSGVVSLEHLDMKFCHLIEKLPDLSNMKMLKKILLRGCIKLHDVDGLVGVLSLEHVDLGRCYSIVTLPELSNLGKLKKLLLEGCYKLCNIEVVAGLASLEYLDVSNCTSIVTFPDMSNLRRLKILKASACRKLFEIRGLGSLISLVVLIITWSSFIETLPDLSNLRKLKQMSLEGLSNLRDIEGLSGLVSLETLDLSYCFSLSNSIDLSCLKKIRRVVGYGRRRLQS